MQETWFITRVYSYITVIHSAVELLKLWYML